MWFDARSQLHFLHLDLVLLLAGEARFTRFLVFVLPVVHDPNHRRSRGRCNLNQIQALGFSLGQRLFHGHDPEL
jgi:hypothetical protein